MLGIAYPFDGSLLCGACAVLALHLPAPLATALSRQPLRDIGTAELNRLKQTDTATRFAAAFLGPLTGTDGDAIEVAPFEGLPKPRTLDRLGPDIASMVWGLAVFSDGDAAAPWLWRGVLSAAQAPDLARCARLRTASEGVWQAVLRPRQYETAVPPEIDADTALPPNRCSELSLPALIPWRLRTSLEEAEAADQLEAIAAETISHFALGDESRFERLMSDALRLPAIVWRERLALVVSAADGLVARPGTAAAGTPRLQPAARAGFDSAADAARKRRMIAFLLARLDQAERGHRPGLDASDVTRLHALYAPSLPRGQRGWAGLRCRLQITNEGCREKPVFTYCVPPDLGADRIGRDARAEMAAQAETTLGDYVARVPGPDDVPLPVAPGQAVIARLAGDNRGEPALSEPVTDALHAIENATAGHPLCGCDRCLTLILTQLRAVFLVMPFRRSNRRLVYNFMLTYYLLRCRRHLIKQGVADSGALANALPIIPWKTSDFVRSSLAQQCALVRDGQRRLAALITGRLPETEPVEVI